jgi:hypothetical protein
MFGAVAIPRSSVCVESRDSAIVAEHFLAALVFAAVQQVVAFGAIFSEALCALMLCSADASAGDTWDGGEELRFTGFVGAGAYQEFWFGGGGVVRESGSHNDLIVSVF